MKNPVSRPKKYSKSQKGNWTIKDPFPGYSKLIQYCLQANLTAYDASYLVLAEAEKIPLITADEKLIKAVEKEIPWIIRLNDFQIN